MAAKADPAARPRSGRKFWLRWTAYTAAGEFAGFSAPALTGAVVFAQSAAMGPHVPDLAARDWVRATALGARWRGRWA